MMSDLEVNLSSDVKGVFSSDVSIPSVGGATTMPSVGGAEEVPSIDSPKNVISEWSPEYMNSPLISRLRPLNTTFFMKPEESVDDESQISSDTPTAVVYEAEQKIRDSIKAIRFKEMLIARDRQSRDVIMQRCIEWLQLPISRGNSKTLDWFMAISLLKTRDALSETYLWHTLHESIYASDSFKTVISFFENL
jgi:hypothetical protein|uniref:Uncharacterized protein n=1 Tax=viral metagenome TaxID=1070528 RepID=A0A6C0K6A5_9ZZZZ